MAAELELVPCLLVDSASHLIIDTISGRTPGSLRRQGVMHYREPIVGAAGEGPRMDHVSVPQAVRPYADQVVAVTDTVCREHLDAEYADLCRAVVGKLGRKRPSPLARGDLRIWAAGVVYAVGQLNFLFDAAQTPYATADQLSEWLGVKKTTMANKARLIRDTLKLSHFDGEFMRRDLVDASPLIWLLEVDGLLVDIRRAPVHLQVQAFELGLIPYVPGPADDRS